MPEPLSLTTRRAIIDFDPNAPDSMTITEFCRHHGITRTSFYAIRKRYKAEGLLALHPHSSAPKNTVRIYDQTTTDLVLKIRTELESTGWDAGPKSIWFHGVDTGQLTDPIPSVATIGRILSDAGRVKKNPKKRPRSSLIRFVRANAMEMWQLDAFEYKLAGSKTMITVYQLLDDSTRFDVGTQAFHGVENSTHAIKTISDAFADCGVPQEMLTDNGNAFNGNRQGWVVRTQLFLADYGCRGISGMPGHPQTQGKNERGHQTLLKVLDANHPRSLEQARRVIVAFRDRYNYRRRHQALPGDMTPHKAWEAANHAPSDGTPIPHAEVEAIARQYAQRRRVLAELNQPHLDDDSVAGEPVPSVDDSVPDRVVISPGNPQIYFQAVGLGVPRSLVGVYQSVVTDDSYALFDTTSGEEVVFFPLPIRTAETHRRYPLWRVIGARMRGATDLWLKKQRGYVLKHFPSEATADRTVPKCH
ncbi:IS481 family transposase [Brevibacterium sp. S111]|nr:IS481 family transposase [Brevibacterium sp. S111]